VLGSERTASSDVPSHGAAAGRLNAGRSAAAEAPGRALSHRMEDQRPTFEENGSAVKIAKESLGLSRKPPAALSALMDYAF